MRKTILSLIGCLPMLLNAQESNLPCRVNDPEILQALHHDDPVLLSDMAAAEAELEAWTAQFSEGTRSTYVVPVVFHIIHNNGDENISNEQVFDAMRILNEDFNKQNPDWPNVRPEFLNLVANIDIEFRLARKDPNGNCTNGITRTVSTLTYSGESDMKALIQWPRNKYLNVWVCANAAGAGGYTLTPGSVAIFSGEDGIVMNQSYVGSIGTGSVSRSRALTHEVGHWINLEHTWGGSNTPGLASNCSTDDGVSDTPNTIGWTVCTLSGTTCSSLDNVENYMDYSYCSKMFTTGQRTRMIAALTSGVAQRNQLTTANNLTATGVNQPLALCAVFFTASNRVICAGGSVTFEDASYNLVTSRNWSFNGGNPATSTDADPTIMYPNAGTFAVSLTASDGGSSLTNNQVAYITVLPVPGGNVPIMEGFETVAGLNGPEWFTVNTNADNTFGTTSVASYSGSKSVRIVNTAAMSGRMDELISTTYDMSAATGIVVTFRYAFAKRTNADDDALRFYISNNCGDTWSLRKILRGSTNLTTGGVVTSSFIPTSASQWGYTEVTNISSTSHVPNFRIKFEFESNGGNNLYLDDININGGPVGVDELVAEGNGVIVIPNPASDRADVLVIMDQAGTPRVDIMDLSGRVLRQVRTGVLPAGTQRVTLPLVGLASGTYALRIQHAHSTRVVRFVVQ
ncbi:MAG: PKD domain-containing protein [Flavobacteriales bacterium]|nr:PKD domain-containing protein [Flavobacteriales bacterium]